MIFLLMSYKPQYLYIHYLYFWVSVWCWESATMSYSYGHISACFVNSNLCRSEIASRSRFLSVSVFYASSLFCGLSKEEMIPERGSVFRFVFVIVLSCCYSVQKLTYVFHFYFDTSKLLSAFFIWKLNVARRLCKCILCLCHLACTDIQIFQTVWSYSSFAIDFIDFCF